MGVGGGRRQLRSLGRHIYFQYRSSFGRCPESPAPSTGPRSRTVQPKRPEVSTKSHNVSTLSQALLTPADYIDISQCMACRITFPGATQPDHGFPYGFVHRENPPGQNHKVHAEPVPFPPHSRGFLYYQTDPQAGPLERQRPLRLTPDNSPASFPAGEDLRAPHGLPWQIALSQVASRSLYAPVGAQLVTDALVTPAQLARCRAAFASHARAIRAPEYTLFRLASTFPINFAHPLNLNVAGADLHKLDLNLVFRASVARIHHPLWTGVSSSASGRAASLILSRIRHRPV
ncbi:hypothetical protein B0H17DRAFT_547179 [Mycena rosella]|uniref:Uncharacterized protein n=1 Tax=Mycena rosella TaxID=1033263 RepID=A0AAD7DK71_MYCRO|nr:hypothetical protein B0H17DRAFT_547179 [Mycena rosella]